MNESKANLDLLSSGDRNNIFSLSQQPCQCYLSRSNSVLFSYLLDTIHEFQDVGEILFAVPIIVN